MRLRHSLCLAALLHLGAALIEAQQGDHAFMDFRAVIDAAAGENHGDFLVHARLLSKGMMNPAVLLPALASVEPCTRRSAVELFLIRSRLSPIGHNAPV